MYNSTFDLTSILSYKTYTHTQLFVANENEEKGEDEKDIYFMDHFRFYISFSWPSAALAVADVSISTLIDGSQFPFREAFNFFR